MSLQTLGQLGTPGTLGTPGQLGEPADQTELPLSPAGLVAHRANLLNQQNPALDPSVNLTLAASGHSTPMLMQIGDAFKTALSDGYNTMSTWTHDPVLQTAPSMSRAVGNYLTGTLGAKNPVAQLDLGPLQQKLQASGYGKGLDVGGIWSPGWQQAFSTYMHDNYASQAAGNRPGAVSGHSFFHGLLSALTPTHLADAVVNYAQALPGQVRNTLADVIAGVSTLGAIPVTEIAHPGVEGLRSALRAGATVGAGIETGLGDSQSAQTYFERRQHFGRMVDDVGTLFIFLPAMKAGLAARGALATVKGGLVADLGEQAAMRGPGVLSRTLTGGIDLNKLDPETRAAILAQRDAGSLARRSLIANFPVIGRTGPWVGKLADSDGLYYRARTVLAQPYRLPIVNAAGTVAQATIPTALYARGQSAIAGKTGGSNLGIGDPTVLDHINDAMTARLSLPGTGHLLALNLDLLGSLLHGPIGPTGRGVASGALRDALSDVKDGVDHLFGQVGVDGQLEQASGLSRNQLIEKAGGEDRYRRWLWNKVRTYTADHYAMTELGKADQRGSAPTDEWARYEYKAAKLHEFYAQPAEVVANQVRQALSSPNFVHDAALKEIVASRTSPDRFFSHDLRDYLDGADAASTMIRDYAGLLRGGWTFAAHDDAKLAAAISGAAEPSLMSTQLANPAPDGMVGLARKDAKLAPHARADAKTFTDRYLAAGGDPTELSGLLSKDQISAAGQAQGVPVESVTGRLQGAATIDQPAYQGLARDLRDYVFTHFGKDAFSLQTMSPAQMISFIDARAAHLAGPVTLVGNNPTAKALLAKIDQAGYQLAYGRDIGHDLSNPFEPLASYEGRVKTVRTIATKLGLNSQNFADESVRTRRYHDVRMSLQNQVDAGKISLPAYWTVDTLIQHINNPDIVGGTESVARKTAFALSARRWARVTRPIAGANPTAADLKLALDKTRDEVLATMGPREMSRKNFVAALTNPDIAPGNSDWLKDQNGPPVPGPAMDERSANRAYNAYLGGYGTNSKYMLGLNHFEDLIRTPHQFELAGHPLIPAKLADLPNNLVRMRNQLRFNLSPFFSFRRVAKSNYKMGLAGIQPTTNPYAALSQSGELEKAQNYYRNLYPDHARQLAAADDADYYLRQSDLFGFYNPIHYEQYAAWHLHQMGLDDAHVRDQLDYVFKYGSRTAAERTANVIFFPFSFEKTLIRNTSYHLMDHPGQAYLAHQVMGAYDQLNDHHAVSNWLHDHLPLLSEAQRLNAFAEGISPGEVGGLNAPFIHALLPQRWNSSDATLSTLKEFIPALRDFNRIVGVTSTPGAGRGDLFDQLAIGKNAFLNGFVGAKHALGLGGGHDLAHPMLPMESRQAQIRDGHRLFLSLSASLAKVVGYNDTHRDGQLTFDPKVFGEGPWVGQPINRTSLRQLVQHFYPDYDPTQAEAYARKCETQISEFLTGLRAAHDPDAPTYQAWADLAGKLVRQLNNPNADSGQLAPIVDLFRRTAIGASEHDSRFLKFYDQHYAWAFGPIERLP